MLPPPGPGVEGGGGGHPRPDAALPAGERRRSVEEGRAAGPGGGVHNCVNPLTGVLLTVILLH